MLHPLPFTMINEFDELSHNGVIGMPEEASVEKGSEFLEAATQGVIALIDEMSEWKFQEEGPARL
jgi:creatinine amidohydrolase/Fe(II)-dependent formamide hydrolase-like protein